MLYCVEVDRSSMSEVDMVVHYKFDKEPTHQDISHLLKKENIGYDDDWCSFEFYRVD